MTGLESSKIPTPTLNENFHLGAYYIISNCQFYTVGITNLLNGSNRKIINVTPESMELNFPLMQHNNFNMPERIIVCLPDETSPFLHMLQILVSVLSIHPPEIEVIILSSCNPERLWHTLRCQIPCRERLFSVYALNSHISWHTLKMFLHSTQLSTAHPSLEKLAQKEGLKEKNCMEGLTSRELACLRELFDGYRIREQSVREKLSPKTLYSQRQSGLKKLVSLTPGIASQVPGMKKRNAISLQGKWSEDEHGFYNALHQGKVYNLYQPIVDREIKIIGFEVQPCWSRNDIELTYKEFFPLLESRNISILLMAFMLRAAVEQINKFNGKLCFTVNIPSSIVESRALLRMVDTARGQLDNPEWVNCLIMVFSEHTRLLPGSMSLIILKKLAEDGYQIILDNLFSNELIILPVMEISLNGYIIDEFFVERAIYNQKAQHFIEGMVYYSRLEEKSIIAKGIDSIEKLSAMKALGIEYFQGHLISRSVLEVELEMTVLGV